jgi:hypothetical protein
MNLKYLSIGPYETGVGKYKHVFFNSDKTTFKMWGSTVLFFIALYEAIKYVVLLVGKRKVRWSMALLLLSSIHSHYYAWWGHWNYWNDDYYLQWAHQVHNYISFLKDSLIKFPLFFFFSSFSPQQSCAPVTLYYLKWTSLAPQGPSHSS